MGRCIVVGTALERRLTVSGAVAETYRISQDKMHADTGADGIIFAALLA
jgi:hypothetical protein